MSSKTPIPLLTTTIFSGTSWLSRLPKPHRRYCHSQSFRSPQMVSSRHTTSNSTHGSNLLYQSSVQHPSASPTPRAPKLYVPISRYLTPSQNKSSYPSLEFLACAQPLGCLPETEKSLQETAGPHTDNLYPHSHVRSKITRIISCDKEIRAGRERLS